MFTKPQNKYMETYRARVVEVDIEDDGEKNKYGAIRVFIPDLMNSEIYTEVDEFKDGILAYPGNMQMAGYNEDDPDSSSFFAAGNVYIPLKNSYVKVIFEQGDLERAFYIGPWHDKIAPLPAVNRNVKEPHKVYTVFTSGAGRCIVICDSEDQARVEITGKKRKLDDSEGPSGNASSVYEIDGNQTTILLDETAGNEKILIKTHKGDFLKFDIEKQTLEAKFKGDIMFETEGKFQVKAKGGVDIKTEGSAAMEAKGSMNVKSNGSSTLLEGKQGAGIKSGGKILIQGAQTLIQSFVSCPAKPAQAASPNGDRTAGPAGGAQEETGTPAPSEGAPTSEVAPANGGFQSGTESGGFVSGPVTTQRTDTVAGNGGFSSGTESGGFVSGPVTTQRTDVGSGGFGEATVSSNPSNGGFSSGTSSGGFTSGPITTRHQE